MTGAWDQAERERTYTAICEAVTTAGRSGETAFLARLVLLLTEELADAACVARCLAEAAAPASAGAETTVKTS